MAFKQKTWTDRVAEFINRRLLTKEDGSTELVTVARSEGTVSTEGDGFTAKNMNDLEQRIADEFTAQNDNFTNEISKLNNALNGAILWTNENPSIQMGAVTVDLDLSKYKNITIKFRNYVTEGYLTVMNNLNKNEKYIAIGMLNNGITTRMFAVNNDGITFENGMYSNGAINTVLIPYQVIAH